MVLQILRALFVLLMAAIGYYFLKEQIGIYQVPPWLMLMVTLTIGVQAEARITPAQSKPDCPFPAQLELVPPMDNGRLAVGVPIDVSFSELNKLL